MRVRPDRATARESLKMNINVCITIFVYRKKDAVSRTMDVRKIGVRQLLRYMALL